MPESKSREAESLRTLANLAYPDPRSDGFGQAITGENCLSAENQKFIDKRIQTINQYKLIDKVPESVSIQFETAKNIYLYAWFVYRFYPVAERQALSTLEFGLREKLEPQIPAYDKKKKQPNYRTRDERVSLSGLLRYVRDTELVVNEDFDLWWHRVEMKAKQRRDMGHIKQLQNGIKYIEYEDSDFTIEEEDKDWDYFGPLAKSLPKIRNFHAHGSSMLYNQILGTFEITTTILNKVYTS